MKLRIYQVDAFTDRLFSGNPAAVCPLEGDWLSDSTMQNIAMENNLAETAFYLHKDGGYHIRWFTPTEEADLCGHATLATAHVLFECEGFDGDEIAFASRSGVLGVKKVGDHLVMDFPSDRITPVKDSGCLSGCFDTEPVEVYRGGSDLMLVFENESEIRNIGFDLRAISQVDARGVMVTAEGDRSDFVSRFFAPQAGIDEDPVTGSAHTTLTPYWSKRLGKDELTAEQLSSRGGVLICRYHGERTEILGKTKLYLTGEIEI
jgi:predicted PhzF superfamily epimerase YddE/YHI9